MLLAFRLIRKRETSLLTLIGEKNGRQEIFWDVGAGV
jgi:hypothetical protein